MTGVKSVTWFLEYVGRQILFSLIILLFITIYSQKVYPTEKGVGIANQKFVIAHNYHGIKISKYKNNRWIFIRGGKEYGLFNKNMFPRLIRILNEEKTD